MPGTSHFRLHTPEDACRNKNFSSSNGRVSKKLAKVLATQLRLSIILTTGTSRSREDSSMVTQRARNLLFEAGLRRTPGRIAMLVVLLRSRQPLTPQEILARVKVRMLDKVSVYRGLSALTQAGIVHRIEAGDRLWRFAVCKHGSHTAHCHPHFSCRVCGKVECLDDVDLPRLKEPAPGYQVEEQEVYMRGLCAKCSEAE